jgi:hypothetical protein
MLVQDPNAFSKDMLDKIAQDLEREEAAKDAKKNQEKKDEIPDGKEEDDTTEKPSIGEKGSGERTSFSSKGGNYLDPVLIKALTDRYSRLVFEMHRPFLSLEGESDIYACVIANAALLHNGERNHYVAVRRINGHLWKFDSLKDSPELIDDFEVEAKLRRDENYTEFAILVSEALPPVPIVGKTRRKGDFWFEESDLLSLCSKSRDSSGSKLRTEPTVSQEQSEPNVLQAINLPPSVSPDGDKESQLQFGLYYDMDFMSLMHNMSAQYFRHRYYWWELIPSSILTMASAVLAFLITSDVINQDTKDIFSVVVGCFSVVATFLTTIGGFFVYGSRRDMHRAAADDLSILRDSLAFDEYEKQLSKNYKTFSNTIGDYRKAYDQANAACKSPVPPAISSVLYMYQNLVTDIVHDIKNQKQKRQIRSAANDILLAEVMRHSGCLWGWPIYIPKETLEIAYTKLGYLVEEGNKDATAKQNFDAAKKYFSSSPEKEGCCPPWMPLCGRNKDTSKPKIIV